MVSTEMWVTVGGGTWEDGGGAAAIPVVPVELERDCVCQNVRQLRHGRVICGKSIHSVHALSNSFKFLQHMVYIDMFTYTA